MSIIITGASGFIGGAIARALLAQGRTVLSVGRTDPAIPGLEHAAWDIAEPAPAALRERTRFSRTVIHCAAAVDDWGDPDLLHAVNVTGARNVLDAFPQTRIIHLSSASVYDPRVPHHELHEEAGPVAESRYPSLYELTKAQAEAVVQRVRPDAVLLRPHAVYGPGDTTLFPRIMANVRKGVLRVPGGGRHPITLTHIDNMVGAALAAEARPGVSGPINVGDPRPYVLREALNTYLARSGSPAVQFEEIPADLALTAAWLAERTARIRRRRPTLTRYAIRHIIYERTYSLSRLEQLLGFQPIQHLAPRTG